MIRIGAETEVNEEKEDDKMDVQVSAGELGDQNHAVLNEPFEVPRYLLCLLISNSIVRALADNYTSCLVSERRFM